MTTYPCLAGSTYATIVAAAPWISALMLLRRSPDASLPTSFPQQRESAAARRAIGAVQDDIIDLLSTARHKRLDDTLRRSARALLAELGQRRTSGHPRASAVAAKVDWVRSGAGMAS